MNRRAISLSLILLLLIAGCSGKQISSSSGDRASKAGQGKSEEILPDAIKTIPLEQSFDRPSGSLPANLSLSPNTVSGNNTLGDIFFDFDQFQIRADAMPVLDANAGWLRANVNKAALIEGHSDERGTLAYNLVLGEKRARTAKKYLQDLGIPASQLETTSYGEARPSCTQQNEGCYQRNRRAHFVTQ
ncbi:MAG: OmpA family protein [Nitrospiraceae bacterium]|jgi:peptidoglycan-associated lipoprotein|nr:OmpA family protein [Nitrospiraceae bacterium]